MARASRLPSADSSRAVAYIRVSTDEQLLGPDAQRAAIAREAARRGLTVVVEFEDVLSGGVTLERRPGLVAAIDALQEHGAGVLLVARRDRLARDVMTAAMVERLAERAGARVVSAAGEGTDGVDGDPAGLLMRRIVDAFAEYERALIRHRTSAALQVKKSRGERVGSVPYGYALAEDGVRLVPAPEEQRAVALVAEGRAAGLPLRAIAARLTEAGLTPRGGGSWHPQTVSNILKAA